MLRPRFAGAFAALSITLLSIHPATAVERIGNAIQIVRTVTGEVQADFRYLILEDPVFQNEVIETKPGSASRIIFRDRTELQVGPEARVTLDSFVFDPDPSLARFFISAFDGVLRFATGKLAKTAYRIETPTAIIGVRGTTFASIFGPTGEQVILLEEGSALTVQNRDGGPLHTLTQPGLSLTVSSDGSVSDPQPPPQWAIDKLRELTALLFTLDEIQRGDQFDDDEKLPVLQEAAVPPPPVAAPQKQPLAAATKREYRPHEPRRQPKPQAKPTHRGLDRADAVASTTAKDRGLALALARADSHAQGTTVHGEYRSDIRIERKNRTVSVHIERDDNPSHTSNQLTADAPKRSTGRQNIRERDHLENIAAQKNRRNTPFSGRRPQNEHPLSAAGEWSQRVSVTVSTRDHDSARGSNRSEASNRDGGNGNHGVGPATRSDNRNNEARESRGSGGDHGRSNGDAGGRDWGGDEGGGHGRGGRQQWQ